MQHLKQSVKQNQNNNDHSILSNNFHAILIQLSFNERTYIVETFIIKMSYDFD